MRAFIRIGVLCLGVTTATYLQADGESPCPTAADVQRGEQRLNEAEALGRGGNHEKAFALLRQIGGRHCFETGSAADRKAIAVMASVGESLGKAAEQQGRFRDAAGIYREIVNMSGAYAEPRQDRAMMELARSKQADRSVIAEVTSYMADARKNTKEGIGVRPQADPHRQTRIQALDAYLKETQTIAAAQGDAALAAEQKAFAARGGINAMFGPYPMQQIQDAKSWYELADAGAMQRGLARAGQRGDQLLGEDAHQTLAQAIAYFDLAENPQKQQAVRDKAKRLGDAAAAGQKPKLAVQYYQVAGLQDQADALAQRTDAQQEVTEKQRRAEFEKGKEDLEKELDF